MVYNILKIDCSQGDKLNKYCDPGKPVSYFVNIFYAYVTKCFE